MSKSEEEVEQCMKETGCQEPFNAMQVFQCHKNRFGW